MVDLIRGSEGHNFDLGDLHLYAGPGLRGSRLPVLAMKEPGDGKEVIVADFRNSTSAAKFINALVRVLDDAKALRIQAAAPSLDAEQQAIVERFGFDTPPEPAEMIERIQLLADEHGVKVEAA